MLLIECLTVRDVGTMTTFFLAFLWGFLEHFWNKEFDFANSFLPNLKQSFSLRSKSFWILNCSQVSVYDEYCPWINIFKNDFWTLSIFMLFFLVRPPFHTGVQYSSRLLTSLTYTSKIKFLSNPIFDNFLKVQKFLFAFEVISPVFLVHFKSLEIVMPRT